MKNYVRKYNIFDWDKVELPDKIKGLLFSINHELLSDIPMILANFLAVMASICQQKFYIELQINNIIHKYQLNLFINLFSLERLNTLNTFKLLTSDLYDIYHHKPLNFSTKYITEVNNSNIKGIYESNYPSLAIIGPYTHIVSYAKSNRKFLEYLLTAYSYIAASRPGLFSDNQLIHPTATFFNITPLASNWPFDDWLELHQLNNRTLHFFETGLRYFNTESNYIFDENIMYYKEKISEINNHNNEMFSTPRKLIFNDNAINEYLLFLDRLTDINCVYNILRYRNVPFIKELVLKIASLLYLYENQIDQTLYVTEKYVFYAINILRSCYTELNRFYKGYNKVRKYINPENYKRCYKIIKQGDEPFNAIFQLRHLALKTRLKKTELELILSALVKNGVIDELPRDSKLYKDEYKSKKSKTILYMKKPSIQFNK